MEILTFKDIKEMIEILNQSFKNERFNEQYHNFTLCCTRQEALLFLAHMMKYRYKQASVLLQKMHNSDYCKEYYISVSEDLLLVNRMYNKGKYHHYSSDSTFITGDCNSRVLKYIHSDATFEVEFVE